MASCWNFSLFSYKGRALHKSFEAAGLESRMISVDNDSTTIHCWVPKDHNPSGNGGINTSKTDNLVLNENSVKSEPKKKKPVLVLLHGFGASSTWQWNLQVKPLLPHFALIIPDLLFFGRSTSVSSQRSESYQADCIWLLLCSLGIDKFSVVGTSYGGFVAYRLAQAHEDAVEKIVLSNSSICMTPEDDKALCRRGGAVSVPELFLPTTRAGLEAVTKLASTKPPALWYFPPFLINDIINVLYNVNKTEKIALLTDLVFGKEKAPALLTKVDKDVLIVWGDSDNIFLPEQAVRIKNYLEERAELVVLKDAGHMSHVEQPAKWNSLVKTFLLGMEVA